MFFGFLPVASLQVPAALGGIEITLPVPGFYVRRSPGGHTNGGLHHAIQAHLDPSWWIG